MRHPGPRRIAAALSCLALAAPVARADLIAALDVAVSTGNLDLTRINATTGGVLTVPATVNTAANEVHPSFSPDGKRIAFLRRDSTGGTTRIIVVDLVSGQSADLFSVFEASADPPSTPVFSEDGTKILTGHPYNPTGSSGAQPSVVETALANFPNGPFPHTVVPVGGPVGTATTTSQPSVGAGGLLAFHIGGGGTDALVVRTTSDTAMISAESARLVAPAIPRQGGSVVVFESIDSTNRHRLAFRPLDGAASAPTTNLPAIVNARDTNAIKPAFSPDGRYLAFLRRPTTSSTSGTRFFVLDTRTQLLLNPQGVPVTAPGNPDAISLQSTQGGIDLFQSKVFFNTGLVSGVLTFGLVADSSVGIIVQRIVGMTRFLGRRVPKLRLVGRVPLGTFAGDATHEVAWNKKVDGKRLRRGRYLVTLRSITDDVQVRDLGEPVQIKIR